MKKPWKQACKITAIVIVCVLVLLVALRITGFSPTGNTPGRYNFPGLWLRGELVKTPVSDWSFTDAYQTIKVQTNTWYGVPHSVTTYCVSYEGTLYLTSIYAPGQEYPHGRNWNANSARDSHVRLKIGDKLYDRELVFVTDPAERAGVLQNKHKKYPNQVIPSTSTVNIFRVLAG